MKVNYPIPSLNKKVVKTNNNINTYGMLFETDLNISNDYYICKDIAIIHKKPTPIQIVKVDYPRRSSAKIIEAYYKTPSTTDYNGIYKGKYIDYEAKETIKNYFSFTHIFKHQVEHLVSVDRHNGIAFVLIYFRISNDVILIDIKDFYQLYLNDNKKSISLEEAKCIGKVCPQGYAPPIDYLKIVDEKYNLD